jgi:hypothetical protein
MQRDRTEPKLASSSVLSKTEIGYIIVFFLAALVPVSAQRVPHAEIFAGYSYLRFESTTIGFADVSNLNGFEVSPAYNFTKNFGIAADASGHYGNHQKIYSFLIGPQIMFPQLHGIIFAHAMFGKSEDKVRVNLGGSSNKRAVALGLGYDRPLSQRLTFRVFQADYLATDVFGVSQNNLRVSTGIVFHWGERKK